jgi:tungstate transport system ATP-binding protein
VVSEMFPLTLSNLSVRRRGKTVLGPIDLVIDQGGPMMVIGPNGSGKTTLLRVMHGIERISEGTATWAQSDQANHGYVFQSPVVLRRSVAENLSYPLQLINTPKPQIKTAVDHWIDRIGLTKVKDGSATRLSGGERQKLAIARALIRDPDVLFLDEPCSNLDGQSTREIEALLLATAAAGTRVIMATHDMGQARRLASGLLFVMGGRIIETGSASDVFSAPKTAELKAFLKGDILI